MCKLCRTGCDIFCILGNRPSRLILFTNLKITFGFWKIWTNCFFEMEFLRQKTKCEKSELYFYHSRRGSWNCPTSKTWSLLRNSFIQSRHILLTFKLNTQNALKFRSSLCSSVLKKLLFNCKAVDYLRQYHFSVCWVHAYPQHTDMQRNHCPESLPQDILENEITAHFHQTLRQYFFFRTPFEIFIQLSLMVSLSVNQ